MAKALVLAGAGNDRYAMRLKLLSLIRLRPITVVGQEAAAKGGCQKFVQSLNIMAIARHLKHEDQTAIGSEDQMLPHADKPPLQRGAIPFLCHAAKALFVSFPYGATYIHGMGVYDEKGGSSSSSSPAISANAPANRSNNGERRVLRSTQFCRESLLGKKSHMTLLFSNQL